MARVIVIRIRVDNQEAINAVKAQREEQRRLNDQVAANSREMRNAEAHAARMARATKELSHVQQGLTNSFIKGNLAARAISATFLTVRNSIGDMLSTGIEFQFVLAKINAISDDGGKTIGSLESSIRKLAQGSIKSAPEIAKVSLEMAKIGLTNNQVKALIPSILTLGTALDEDLVTAGETVVRILNTYGMSVSEGQKVSEQLAFTVAASALDLEKFGTAFSYVGGTAAVAGVKFEDLAGAMDFLSNAGVRSSTIGTQLRRIIADLSDESSKASQAIGGSLSSVGGFIPALEKLNKILPKDPDKRIAALTDIFGRTASSVAALLIRDTEAVQDFSDRTAEASGNLTRMQEVMDGTFKAALERQKNAWREFGMTVGESTSGIGKFFVNLSGFTAKALTNLVSLDDERARLATEMSKVVGGGFGDLRVMDDEALKEQLSLIKELPQAFEDTEEAVVDLEAKIKALNESFSELASELDWLEITGKDINYQSFIDRFNGLAQSLENLGSKKDAVKVLREIQQVEEALFDSQIMRKGDDLTGGKRMLDFINSTSPSSFEEKEARTDQRREQSDRFSKASDLFDKSTSKTIENIRQYNETVKEFELQTSASFAFMSVAVDSFSDSLGVAGDMFTDVFLGKEGEINNFGDAFEGVMRRMVSSMIELMIRLAIFKMIVGSLGLGTGGFGFMNAGGTGFLNGFLQGLGGTMAPTKAANGFDGMVTGPRLFLAGEGGEPERVKITPLSKMGSEGGGNTYITVQGDVFDSEKLVDKIALTNERTRTRYV